MGKSDISDSWFYVNSLSGKSPGNLPKGICDPDLGIAPGSEIYAATKIHPNSGGIYGQALVTLIGLESVGNLNRVWKHDKELQRLVTVTGSGRYQLHSGYVSSLGPYAEHRQKTAKKSQVAPLKKNWTA